LLDQLALLEYVYMADKIHETIIIGAGIAGLACARKLHENGKGFLVISEDIGGSITTSEDGRVNYGAQYVNKDFHNVNKFVKVGRKIGPKDLLFHEADDAYTFALWEKRVYLNLLELARLMLLLVKFRKHYEAFKKKCEFISQSNALRSDKFLWDLYNQNATDFAIKHKLNKIVKHYASKTLRALSLQFQDINSFTFLQWSLPLIMPLYEFTLQKEKMVDGFEKNITIDTVIQIVGEKGGALVRTKKQQYYSKNVVVATPPHISKELLNLRGIKAPTSAHLFHISGRLREAYNARDINLFSEGHPLFTIDRQIDGSYIYYTSERKPKFDKYFHEYKVMGYKEWSPVFNVKGSFLWECEQDRGLYLIGNHNILSLEDPFIMGIYAANRIIEESRKR